MTAAALHEDIVIDYVAGRLSPAKHLIMECQRHLSEEIAKDMESGEEVAGMLLSEQASEALSPDFMGRAISCLPPQAANDLNIKTLFPAGSKTANFLLNKGLDDLKWASIVPGVAIKDVVGHRKSTSGERLYFMRAKSGVKMPEHGHSGEEWTLLLKGSYIANGQRYACGDLHISGEDEHHAPHVEQGEDCICLVMSQGPVVMKSLMGKLVQPLVGI